MKNIIKGAVFALLAGAFTTLQAQVWNLNGNGNWNDSSNWSTPSFPNSAGASATLGNAITSNRTISLGQNITLGTLTIADDNNYKIRDNTLIFDVHTGTASIASSGGGDPTILSAVTLYDNINLSAATGSTLTISGDLTGYNHNISVSGGGTTTLSGAVSTTGSLIKNDTGVLVLNRGEDNTFGSVTVNKGTLLLNSPGNTATIGGSGTITINSTGTLLLGHNNQIANTVNMVLNGGTFSTGDTVGHNETLSTLTLSANSTINLGTGSDNLIFAASNGISWTGTLTISGWVGTAGASGGGTQGEIFFGSNASGLTSTQLSKIDFTGFGQGALILSNGQLVPIGAVPEAKVVFGVLLLVGGIFWQERRRVSSLFRKTFLA